MRGTRLWRLRVSLAVRNGARATQAESLGRRWADLDAARPANLTGPATELLRETIAHLQESAPALKSSSASLPAAASSSLSTSPPLLSTRESAQHIWRSLRRQRVPWQDALALLPWQLQAMTPAQRQFLSSQAARTPARVASLALAAWDMHEDAALVQQYRSLKRSAYMVDYARLVSAALRERPSLPNGLLPVPYGVVEHGYALGLCSPQDAKIALALSKHMTLLGREALTREAEECLVLRHAALEGLAGHWQAALGIVQHSRAVRLSAREGMKRYVRSLLTRQGGVPLTTDAPLARSCDSSVSKHGDARAGPRNEKAAPAEFAAEAPLRREDTSANWVDALCAFLSKEPHTQTYPGARHVLESLPPEVMGNRTYLLLASTVLHCCARRMFAGTLTRRVASYVANANWAMALALTCAAQYYDVAAPLIPLATKGSSGGTTGVLDVPPELRAYVAAVRHSQQEERPAAAETSSLTVTEAAALTYPEALAHALTATSPATWRTLLLSCPHAGPPTRLRYFLLAACGEARDATLFERTSVSRCAEDRIECCTFQSCAVSRLICAAAEPRNQQYFFKVIPASARAHHFERSPLINAPTRELGPGLGTGQRIPAAAAATTEAAQALSNSAAGAPAESALLAVSVTAARARLQTWRRQTVTTPEECTQLLADVSLYLRATHRVEGAVISAHQQPRLTEDVFLKAVAALAASGVLQLAPPERFHWPLAVLKTARLLRVQVDASLMAATARTIPSMFVDRTGLALPSILGAHTLLGDWKAGLQLCTRLLRKQQDGEIEVDADTPRVGKPQTHRFTAPPPTLLEAMAQVGYASPAAVAVRHWQTLEASSASTLASLHSERSCALPLLLLELQQFHDERQLCEEVRHLCAGRRRGSPQQKLNALSRRRMLLGAAFCLLDNEAALRRVLRAAGKEKARSADVDTHGLQRLLRVVQSTDAAQVLAAEAREGRCAHEHWLCEVMSRSDVAADAAGELARLRPFSATLSALWFFKQAAAAQDAAGCLKGLVRLAERASECPYPDGLLLSLLRLLRLFLSHGGLLSASVVTREMAEGKGSAKLPRSTVLALACKLFNRMQEMQRLSLPLKAARRVLRRASDAHLPDAHAVAGDTDAVCPGKSPAAPCAVWALLGVLHSTASSVLQVPVPASFTSSLLSRVVETNRAADWWTALLFFQSIRHPTMQERALLVRALRHCGGAATPILLSNRRFLRDCPEQVVIWADEASGQSKWSQSLTLLEHAQEVERRTTASAAEADQDASDSMEPARAPASLLSPAVVAIIRGWNADERLRCGELLRRQGFIATGSSKNGTPLDDARVTKMANPRAQRQAEAILQLLKEKPSAAVPFINAPPRLDADHPGVRAARRNDE
ncbi:conserved hypothetical protein [Leishmania infantum JPCM5]|uniref:Uncharacterized protein n=2 Tax=Leishmania infantum TaxID=5671 RepID=A4IAD6_LEIIN|nr:conserved hypothetical protein [Leishmania infantum JPCM5]CAC9541014.1 hypothetical_protein_-_conserved [Leishmania infantum]CAM71793.1 conserved hypothetical protein [Leishmania infantum JPCM5]SUZ45748.1 hypothetical_protein_-_conserved [Leishmania infantum]|eukprot:XP_001468705.1 conserved hypothetical protein [Leishmania infantum JPCM5]